MISTLRCFGIIKFSFFKRNGFKCGSTIRVKAYGIRRESAHGNGIKLHCISVRNENIEGVITYADSRSFAWYRLRTVNVASYYIACAIIYCNIVKEREYGSSIRYRAVYSISVNREKLGFDIRSLKLCGDNLL